MRARAKSIARFALFACVGYLAGPAVVDADQTPTPDEVAKASARFQKGVELYQAGDIRAALIEFRRAYKIAPTYQLLFNIGQAASELKDYVQAFEAFSAYLADGGDDIDAERVAMIEDELARLKTYLASLSIEVGEAGAEIMVDGVVVGTSPLGGSVLVSAGRRSVVVAKSGFSRWERVIDLAGEDEQTVVVELISMAPVAPVRSGVDGGEGRSRFGAAFWISAGATAALAAGTGAAGFLTMRAQDDYDKEIATVPTTQAAIDDAAAKVKRTALITDIGIGLTAAGLVTTVVLAIRGGSDGDPPESGVALSVGPGLIGVAGHF